MRTKQQATRARLSATVCGAAIVALSACGSSDSAAPASPAGDAGAFVNLTPFTVWVFELPSPGATGIPLAGASVAFDPPAGGGDREEVTTDADGKAIVHGDFSKGPGTVTAYAAGHAMVTSLDVSPDDVKDIYAADPASTSGKPTSDLVMYLLRTDDEGFVFTHINFTNPSAAGTWLDVGASNDGGQGHDAGGPFGPVDLRVPKGVAHFIIGCEYTPIEMNGNDNDFHKCFRVGRPAQDTDGTLDVDVSAVPALPATDVHVKTELPGGASGPFAGVLADTATVTFESSIYPAPGAKNTSSPDGASSDAILHLLSTDFGGEHPITQSLLRTKDGAVSARIELGLPQEGFVFKDFLAPLPVTISKQTLADPLPLDGFPDGAQLQVWLSTTVKPLVWGVTGHPTVTKPRANPIRLPAPPSTFKVPPTMTAHVQALADPVALDPSKPAVLFRKASVSRGFTVTAK